MLSEVDELTLDDGVVSRHSFFPAGVYLLVSAEKHRPDGLPFPSGQKAPAIKIVLQRKKEKEEERKVPFEPGAHHYLKPNMKASQRIRGCSSHKKEVSITSELLQR